MGANSTYDKVRAAYGLDDDDDLKGLALSSSTAPEVGMRGGWGPSQRGYNNGNNGNNGRSGNESFGRGHNSAANRPDGIPIPADILERIRAQPPLQHYNPPWLESENTATENERNISRGTHQTLVETGNGSSSGNGSNGRNGNSGGNGKGPFSGGHNAAATHIQGIPIRAQTQPPSLPKPCLEPENSSSEDGGVSLGDVHLAPKYVGNGSNGSNGRNGIGPFSFGQGHNGIPMSAHLLETIHESSQPSVRPVVGSTSTTNAGCDIHQTPGVTGNSSAAKGQHAQRHPHHADDSTTSQNQFSHDQSTHPNMQFNYCKCTDQIAGVPQPPPPAPPPTAPIVVPSLEKVNSVRVPFDPEDQSDDEVVITSAYSRGVRNGEYAKPVTHDEPAASQKRPTTKTLSATAAPFFPESAPTSVSGTENQPKPLVDTVGANGNPDLGAVAGDRYSHYQLGFVPWILVSNYHLWFVGRKNSERIMPYFNQEALLKAQSWDFCYVWRQPRGKKADPVLLVPTRQFQHFMERINHTLGIQLIIPTDREGEKFRVHFGEKTPVPRFLGRAADETAFSIMKRNVPMMDAKDKIDNLLPPVAGIYAKKIEGLLLTYGKDKKATKNAKAEQTKLKRKIGREAVGRQIKRVQRYLGLRPNAAKATRLPSASRIDLTKPVPHAREEDVILVSMDIEAYEHSQKVVTEIGFGILDTRDIANVPPGAQCISWFEQIQGRHIRIQERAHMINRKYVMGNEENFNFGETEFVKLKDVLQIVTDVLQPSLASGEPRKVILVGHNIQSDIKMIANIGYTVNPGSFFEILDTQDIHQHFRMHERDTSLGGMLNDLEIDHSFMHNGGNDAVYTLQALLSLVLKKRQGSLQRKNERLKPGFVLDADVEARGWASGGEDSDGGYADNL